MRSPYSIMALIPMAEGIVHVVDPRQLVHPWGNFLKCTSDIHSSPLFHCFPGAVQQGLRAALGRAREFFPSWFTVMGMLLMTGPLDG